MEEGTKGMFDQVQQIPLLIDQEAEHVKGAGTVTGESITNQNQYHIRGTTALYATVSGIAVGRGGSMHDGGLSLIASVTILLISSPLLLIFSPLSISAALVLVGALAGLAAAAILGVAGVWAFRFMIQTSFQSGDIRDRSGTEIRDMMPSVITR